MANTVMAFQDVCPEFFAATGGKGGMLARMYQSGYPVPEGFVILPSAFRQGELTDEAHAQIVRRLDAISSNVHKLRQGEQVLFAVRSSALSEGSSTASFAGEFETVLNVAAQDVMGAVHTVFRSSESERVKVYSTVQGMDSSHLVAVVVQLMVQSEMSGVLFTADPITGSHTHMVGNLVHGLGEQLVSGESNADSFHFLQPKGKYEGPQKFKPYAARLFKLAFRLEREYGGPQDIEWSVANGNLYVLQSRPITTISVGNPNTYEWNDSLDGDYLWVNTNIGEAIPDILTPLTWSLIRSLDKEIQIVPNYYMWSGNICGRAYTNLSQRLSAPAAFGVNPMWALKFFGDVFGQVPEGVTLPVYPFRKVELIRGMLPRIVAFLKKLQQVSRNMEEYLAQTSEQCRELAQGIHKAETAQELLSLWQSEIRPACSTAWWSLIAGGSKAVLGLKLTKELTRLVGIEDANALLSNLRGNASLESLGPVTGIAKIINGEISRETYLAQYGHRGPHEFELSIPHPAENIAWLDSQIGEFRRANTDVLALLDKQREKYAAAWERFKSKYPGKVRRIEKKIEAASAAARLREAVRSEFVRVFRVVRVYALKVGELTGIGDDVFFLYIDEVLSLLAGDDSAIKHIPARRKNYEEYVSLPPFPAVIRGRFDPLQWAADPNRRADYYNANAPVDFEKLDSTILKGFAGAAGRIEGKVRILASPEDGEDFQQGEILVATTTNIGWTPLFPRASAIVTDIGAPLSHAAIVARELGIPAVVGCKNATTLLQTGDRVAVDGGKGIVQILSQISIGDKPF